MKDTLYKRIKIMTICATVELCTIPVCLILLGCFLFAFFSGGVWLPLVFPVLICVGIITFCTLYPKHLGRTADLSPYAIPITASDFESVCTVLAVNPVAEDAACGFCKVSGFSVRLLAQFCKHFDFKALSARRKVLNNFINRRFSISQSGPSYEILKRVRINLVVCRNRSDDAINWLRQDPVRLLQRNEAIVNAVICLDQQLLFIPACLYPLIWNEIRRYRAAVQLLTDKLC